MTRHRPRGLELPNGARSTCARLWSRKSDIRLRLQQRDLRFAIITGLCSVTGRCARAELALA
jgi:hypothetical protein